MLGPIDKSADKTIVDDGTWADRTPLPARCHDGKGAAGEECRKGGQVANEDYRKQGYAHLPALFPREVLLALYARMQADLKAQGRPLSSFAAQGPLLKRPALEVYAYQYAPLLGFLWGLTPRIAAEVGAELLPTYAYFRAYQHGDVCRIHHDRPACEHSVSLTIAYGEDRPWSLSVQTTPTDTPRPEVTEDFGAEPFGSVAMQPGDGVLYQGTHHRHGRLDANPNSWSAHLFLHWVEKDGRYADHAFDRPAMERAARGQ